MRHLTALASAITFVILSVASAFAQKTPPRLEVFGEGGGSFLTGGSGQVTVVVPGSCPPIGPCPAPTPTAELASLTSSFSKTGRLVAGARLRFAA